MRSAVSGRFFVVCFFAVVRGTIRCSGGLILVVCVFVWVRVDRGGILAVFILGIWFSTIVSFL